MVKSSFIQVITEGHRGARGAIQNFMSSKSLADKRKAAHDLFYEFSVRAALEERYVIPEFQKLDTTDVNGHFKAFNQITKDNMEITSLFSRAERLVLNDQRLEEEQATFNQLMGEAITLMEKQLSHQSSKIIPKFESGLHQFKSEELGHDASVFRILLDKKYNEAMKRGFFVGNEYFAQLNGGYHNIEDKQIEAKGERLALQ